MDICQNCRKLQGLKAENERLNAERDLMFLLLDLVGAAVEKVTQQHGLIDSKEQFDQSGSQRANQIRMLTDQIGKTGKEVTGNRLLALFQLLEDGK